MCCILHQFDRKSTVISLRSINVPVIVADSTQNKPYSNVIHILQDNKVYSDGNSIRQEEFRSLISESEHYVMSRAQLRLFLLEREGIKERVFDQQNFSLGDKLSYQMRLDYKNEGTSSSISSHFFWKKILILSLRNL